MYVRGVLGIGAYTLSPVDLLRQRQCQLLLRNNSSLLYCSGKVYLRVGSVMKVSLPLTMNSIITSTRLKEADFFTSKSLTVVIKISGTTSIHLLQAVSLHVVTHCKHDSCLVYSTTDFFFARNSFLKNSLTGSRLQPVCLPGAHTIKPSNFFLIKHF